MEQDIFKHSLVNKILGCSNPIDALRDMSLALKGVNNDLAFKLISLAHEQRPAGEAIKNARSRILEDLYINQGLNKSFYIEVSNENIILGETIASLLPGLGFFDSSGIGSLKVKIKRTIKSLKVLVTNPHDEFMNLRHLKIFSEDGTSLKNEIGLNFKEYCSSSRTEICGSLFNADGHHSKKEKSPYYIVEFDEPVYVEWLEVGNREDYQGIRSRCLLVETECEYGIFKVDYATTSQENINFILSGLQNFLGKSKFSDLSIFDNNNESDKKSLNMMLLKSILANLKINYLEVDASTWWCVLQCLDVWGKKNNHESKEIEREIVSYYVARSYLERNRKLPKSFEMLFKNKDNISNLESLVNSHIKSYKGDEIMLTKHGLAGKGKLVNDVDNCLKALGRVFTHLEKMGYQPLLAYGTLLGAVRENAFLDHDDDIDIIFVGKARSLNEAQLEMEEVISYFENLDNYRVGVVVNKHLNRHIKDKELGVIIDVFPIWKSEQLAYLHMEKMVIRGIDSTIFKGIGQAHLYGQTFAAPLDSRQFLAERYGEEWETPDKFHEWPWTLEN